MAIIKLGKENFDNSTLITYASRSFEWSSTRGVISGNIPVYVERSNIEKDAEATIQVNSEPWGTGDLHDLLIVAKQIELLKLTAAGTSSNPQNLTGSIETYWALADLMGPSKRKQQFKTITRHIPSPTFSASSSMKSFARKTLFDSYKVPYRDTQWAYNNYHCLNFFTASNVPTGSALIYPAITMSTTEGWNKTATLFNAPYRPGEQKGDGKGFGFSFWINPKYDGLFDSVSEKVGEFRAGTIMHMSSCYAISLVTGSAKDPSGRPDSFRVMLQLSHSAEIPPSKINLNYANNTRGTVVTSGLYDDMVFLTSPISLKKNHWHHVAITWGTKTIDKGFGHFYVDGKRDSWKFRVTASNPILGPNKTFPCPAGVLQKSHLRNPDALFIGNFYEGANSTSNGSAITSFFNTTIATAEGLTNLDPIATSDPIRFTMNHPLNAEIHDLRIHNSHQTSDDVKEAMAHGPLAVVTQSASPPVWSYKPINPDLMLYIPPFFVKDSRPRNILTTPYTAVQGKTTNPVNARLSLSTNINDINLENFTREFVRDEYPRLYSMGALRRTSPNFVRSNGYGYEINVSGDRIHTLLGSSPGKRKDFNKRNLTILPCDNGLFRPNFFLLATGSKLSPPTSKYDPIYKKTLNFPITSGSALDKYTDDKNHLDFSYINISDTFFLDPAKKIVLSNFENSDKTDYGDPSAIDIFEQIAGATPYLMGVSEFGAFVYYPNVEVWPYMCLETGDASSNAIVMFNIPNLYYGDRIKPGSFKLRGGVGTTKLDTNAGLLDTLSVTLRDNAMGGLYRANAVTPHATWNCVGALLYNEGFPLILSPHLKDFGDLRHDLFFQGNRNVHVLEIMVPCHAGLVNSSSNPTYKPLAPTSYALETAKDFVYITGLNFHDDNLNVIARTNLAQPIVKRSEDHYMFRIKIDF